MPVNGLAAANWLREKRSLSRHGYCLYYVWQAYAAHGAETALSARTALAAWNLSEGKHHGDQNPPAGVPVWFGEKPGSRAGDVVISLGSGRVVCTDYPAYGVVGVCTIAERQAQIRRPYLGWTERIFDVPIAHNAPAGNPQQEEDDMDYDTFASYLQRALRYDVRPDGIGADWRLGPTLWERFNQIQAAAGSIPHDADDLAKAIVDAIPGNMADSVLDALAERLAREKHA